jgi:hypothetical protein
VINSSDYPDAGGELGDMDNLREKLKREQQLVIQLEKDLQNREMALQLARYQCIRSGIRDEHPFLELIKKILG